MRWGVAAAAAEAVFLLLWGAAEVLSPQSPRAVTVSDLVLARPWLVTLAFVAHAVALAALAPIVLDRQRGAGIAASVAAVGMLLVAVFPVEAAWTWRVTMHTVGAWLAFGGVAVAAALVSAAVRPRFGWLCVAVFVGTVLMLLSAQWGLFPVTERIQLLLNGAWIFALASPRAFSTPAKSPAP